MASSGARPRNIEVSVEKLLEYEIEEISHSGEEKYRKPFSLSEEFTNYAHKIDFIGDEEEQDLQNGNGDDEKPENKQDQSKKDQWPWESVRTKLRNALSEVCVLLDVLQVMKEKKYLVLEPVTQNAEPPRQVVQMIGKRKSLAKAAEVIRLGAERMMQGNSDEYNGCIAMQAQPAKQDYFSELMKLRQRWKVKKTGGTMTGDLSYRSAGSTFWHPGLFDVKKTDDLPEEERDSSGCPLTVRVGSDLDDFSRVRVKITDLTEQEEDMDIDDVSHASIASRHPTNADPSDKSPWQKKLKQAQHNLFCKELFSQISREAFHSKNFKSVQITGNTIRLQLFPDSYAEIIYEKALKDEGSSYESLLSGNGDVLEFRLQQLLHKQHLARINTPTPRPANAPWTTRDHNAANLQEYFVKKNVTYRPSALLLLDEFYDELKHVVLRKRTSYLFDRMAVKYTDPSIAMEWSANAGPKISFANIHLFSKMQRLCYRTSFHLKVDLDKYEAVDMKGKAVRLPGVLQDLEEYVKIQIALHFANVALGIFEDFGWEVLQHPINAGSDEHHQCFQLKGRSSSHQSSIKLFVATNSSFQVSIQKTLAAEEDASAVSTLLDAKWTKVEGEETSIDWRTLNGTTFAEKFYGLVASLP